MTLLCNSQCHRPDLEGLSMYHLTQHFQTTVPVEIHCGQLVIGPVKPLLKVIKYALWPHLIHLISENINVSPKHIHRLKQPLSFLFSSSFLLLKRLPPPHQSSGPRNSKTSWADDGLFLLLLFIYFPLLLLFSQRNRGSDEAVAVSSLCVSVLLTYGSAIKIM